MEPKHPILCEFAQDPDLPALEEMLSEFDPFDFLELSGKEAIHSKILEWLLNPNGSHSLGASFLKNFLLETRSATEEQIGEIDWSKTSIRQEWHNKVDGETGRLDILILNSESLFVCGIENKIFSGEHSRQLTRYREAMIESYPGYCRSYLFLTPEGETPSDRCWKPVKYEVILKLVEMVLAEKVEPENEAVSSFLNQYLTTLRRNIVPDTEMKQLATKIYLRHRKTLDFIYANRDNHLKDIVEFCKEAIDSQCRWRYLGEERGTLVSFLDDRWEQFDISRTGEENRIYAGSPLLKLDFDLRQTGKVLLILTLCPGENSDVREHLFNGTQGRYPGIFNPRSSERGGRLLERHTRLYESEPVLTESDFLSWDKMEVREKIQNWVASFVESDFPEMNATILGCLREIEEGSGWQVEGD